MYLFEEHILHNPQCVPVFTSPHPVQVKAMQTNNDAIAKKIKANLPNKEADLKSSNTDIVVLYRSNIQSKKAPSLSTCVCYIGFCCYNKFPMFYLCTFTLYIYLTNPSMYSVKYKKEFLSWKYGY